MIVQLFDTFVRHLSAEIIEEYAELVEQEKPTDALTKLITEIVPFFLSHNAEADACDLLIETESLSMLPPLLDKDTFPRVTLYLTR